METRHEGENAGFRRYEVFEIRMIRDVIIVFLVVFGARQNI